MTRTTKYPYHYRYDNCTHKSVKRVHNVANLGVLFSIEGRRMKTTRSYMSDGERRSYTTTHEAVVVRGERGTCKFEGFCWGYGGEGPHGLVELFLACGVSRQVAEYISFTAPRNDPKVGVDWKYNCQTGEVTFALESGPVTGRLVERLIAEGRYITSLNLVKNVRENVLQPRADLVGYGQLYVNPDATIHGLSGVPQPLVARTEASASDPTVLKWACDSDRFIDPPAIGTHIKVTMNGMGSGTVSGYFMEDGYLGVEVILDAAPQWWLKNQKECPDWAKGKARVFGTEIKPW